MSGKVACGKEANKSETPETPPAPAEQKVKKGDPIEVNADGKGWLAYLNKEKGLLLVKQFVDLVAGQPAPDEAEIQVYVNRGKTYIELESQGAYTTLQPGEELSWTVRWYLQPSTPASSDALVQQVKNMLKTDK